jgi:hypothetical protein
MGQTTFGISRDKSAAWVDCEHSDRLGELIVWTNGEVELAVASPITGGPHQVHYDLTSPDEIAGCLRDLTQRLPQSEPALISPRGPPRPAPWLPRRRRGCGSPAPPRPPGARVELCARGRPPTTVRPLGGHTGTAPGGPVFREAALAIRPA